MLAALEAVAPSQPRGPESKQPCQVRSADGLIRDVFITMGLLGREPTLGWEASVMLVKLVGAA